MLVNESLKEGLNICRFLRLVIEDAVVRKKICGVHI